MVPDITQLGKRYLMDSYRRVPLTLVRGSGVTVTDIEGRDYIDLVAGIAVNSLGHAHPALLNAIAEQARHLIQTSSDYMTIPPIELAQRLVALAFPSRVFLANSGAEANECAVKIARKWGRIRKDGAHEVITALGSFHGRTLAMITATGQTKYSDPFHPLPPGFLHVTYGDIEAIRRASGPKTAAIMLEPIIGEGGMIPAPEGYLEAVRQWCDDQKILLILDEIQTGVARTGRWFAHQHYGITPDVMTLAKGLGGGVPISACLVAPNADVFVPGDHGSTFGGNPLAAAAAIAVIGVIEQEGLVVHAEAMGRLLTKQLSDLDGVREVRGLGLMLGAVLEAPVAREVRTVCLQEGVLVNAISDRILRIVPPLIINSEQIHQATAAIGRALTYVLNDKRQEQLQDSLPNHGIA